MVDEYDVYIGRGRGSIWGNPFSHKSGTAAARVVDSVEEAVKSYREYVLSRPELLERVGELKGKRLGCWCKTKGDPNALCHGDVLAELADAT
jgi:hypothetical protein